MNAQLIFYFDLALDEQGLLQWHMLRQLKLG